MPFIDSKVRNPKKNTEVIQGLVGGLNTFQDQNVIKDNELTHATNIELLVDGIVPRRGTVVSGDTDPSKIYGLFGYYKSDGTHKFLKISDQKLKYLNGNSWTTIGTTTFANEKTVMVQAMDKVFFFNGSDNLRVYDGSTISTYTELTTPTNLAYTLSGTSGTTSYSYRVSAFNDQGETLASSAISITDGNATLTTTNKINLTWDAVTGATGYNVWGNKSTGLGETFMETVYTNSYSDTGEDTPSITVLPPEGNTTGGIKGKYACFAMSRIFVAGNPDDPSRLYWGGLGDNVDNYSGDISGGGSTSVFENDGFSIKAIIPFQGGVIVGKENAIYKFSFVDNEPRLEEITRSFGIISHYATLAVENDIVFPAKKDGRLAFYSLGNQENYAASVLRTNELSIKVSKSLENVALDYLDTASGGYFNNLYMCSVPKDGSTTNDVTWVLDTRFGSWVNWEGISPAVYSEYIDSNGNQDMYYGHETDGYVYKMFQSDRNDNGASISVKFASKAFDQKLFHKYKRYYNPTFQFKDVSSFGTLNGDIIVDGTIISSEFSINSYVSGGLGFGAMLFGGVQFGDATGGTPSSGDPSDQLIEVQKTLMARSIKYSFTSDTKDFYYKFLSMSHEYSLLEGRKLQSQFKVYT